MHNDKIRNVPAFLRSYMQSNSGQRALSRQPSYVEVDTKEMKGRILVGFNTMAHAMQQAVA